MLERYRRRAELTRQLEPPEPEPIDGEENWIVREIVDSRRNNRKKGKPIEYLVLWEGYSNEEATFFFFFFFKSNDPACGLDHGRDSGAPTRGAPHGPESRHIE